MKCIYPDQVDEPNLTQLIQEFIHGQQHPESSPHNIPDLPPFYEKITVYTSILATFHTPSDLSGIGGMKHKHIHAVNRWQNGPGHYDTLFVNAAINDEDQDGESSVHGFLGLEVAQACLFFSFALEGVMYPCALVHWFSHATDTPSDVTGMYVVEPEYLPKGQPAIAVVHLDTLFRAAHLLPVYSKHQALSKHQRYEETLDLFSEFYVNRYINYHAFKVVT